MMQQFSVTMRPTKTNQECVEGADIITSVTTSKRATFSAEWVKKGAQYQWSRCLHTGNV